MKYLLWRVFKASLFLVKFSLSWVNLAITLVSRACRWWWCPCDSCRCWHGCWGKSRRSKLLGTTLHTKSAPIFTLLPELPLDSRTKWQLVCITKLRWNFEAERFHAPSISFFFFLWRKNAPCFWAVPKPSFLPLNEMESLLPQRVSSWERHGCLCCCCCCFTV